MSLMDIIDITERVRAQGLLQRVQADFCARARVAMLGELTASIAHEVNQPLHPLPSTGQVGCGYSIAPSRIGLKCAN